MLNGLYGYLFGSEDVNYNNIKENVVVMTNSTELLASASPNGIPGTKDDDWVLLDGQISGRSTPVFVPEPDLIAIDDDMSITTAVESVRSESPVLSFPVPAQKIRYERGFDDGHRSEMLRKHFERMERVRQIRQKANERKELERQLFEDQVLRSGNEADKKQANNANNNNNNNYKALNMLNNATKMKRSTAAGHFAADSKTKPRSKKSNRLIAGRNNDRKVNNVN